MALNGVPRRLVALLADMYSGKTSVLQTGEVLRLELGVGRGSQEHTGQVSFVSKGRSKGGIWLFGLRRRSCCQLSGPAFAETQCVGFERRMPSVCGELDRGAQFRISMRCRSMFY